MQPIGGKHRLQTQKVAAIVEKDIWHLIPFWNINQQLSWKQVDVGWFCEPVLKIEKTFRNRGGNPLPIPHPLGTSCLAFRGLRPFNLWAPALILL